MNRTYKSAIAAVLLGLLANNGPAAEPTVTVVNCSDKPVYATAISIPLDAASKALGVAPNLPLELVQNDGTPVPLVRHESGLGTQLRTILSLKPRQRLDFALQSAKAWGVGGASASFDPKTGTGSLSNGILRLDYAEKKWSLAYACNPDAKICQNNRLDFWLSDEQHGRLLGFKEDKLREMNLLRSTEKATLVESKAVANPDGSATLVLTHGFPGWGESVLWEETFTLQSFEPVLIYKNRWVCTSGDTRYLTYVDLGGALKGEFGPLLKGKYRFKYDIPASGSEQTASGISVAKTTDTSTAGPRILLSGKNNNYTRISWRNERCWVGVDSELGNGLAFSTLKDANVRFIPGNTVWAISNNDYLIRLLDDVQENQPYAFSKARPLELGFAIAPTCGGVGIWNQGRKLFKAVTNQNAPSVGSAAAIYLDGQTIRPGETSHLTAHLGDMAAFQSDGTSLRAHLETDFTRPFHLVAKVAGATPDDPLKIVATSDAGDAFTLATFDAPGEKTIDFTGVTGWLLSRRAYTLTVQQGTKGRLESLVLEAAPFEAPRLDLPANGMDLTDVATFFRWFQVRGAIDYEIQLSRTSDFKDATTLTVRSEVPMPYYLPTDSELPDDGKWNWRVRAIEEGRPGEWSATRGFNTNSIHSHTPLVFKPSPETPLFTFEGCRVPDWSRFKDTLPEDIKPYAAFNTGVYGTNDYIGYFRPIQEMEMRTFLRTHGPGPMSDWTPLSMVEELFQKYPNIIGITGGESLSTHYHGGDNQVFTERLLKLCAKYGRMFYDADGSYPSENKFQALYEKKGPFMESFSDYLVLAQKNNILHRQFVTQSSVLGLFLANDIVAQGAWEDGGWYWQQVGFRTLGEILGQRAGDVTNMPRIFWTLNHVMGLARGCSVFSFEGQVGTTPVPRDWRVSEKGLPEITDAAYRNPAAFWTTDGERLLTFDRYILPFIRGVIANQLVPTKGQVLDRVRLAVYNDGVPKKKDGDQYYYEWEALYRGTYGFRDVGVHPGTLMEFFPNTGRFFFIPVLPQGARALGPNIQILPLSELGDVAEVKRIFGKAYPAWYSGNAFVVYVGDTLTILNSCENLDETQTYSVPFVDRGTFTNISGTVGPHAYLIGRFEGRGNTLWLQANTEYPERDTELTLTLKSAPKVTVTPAKAAKVNRWDESTRQLHLVLSHAEGAVDVAISN